MWVLCGGCERRGGVIRVGEGGSGETCGMAGWLARWVEQWDELRTTGLLDGQVALLLFLPMRWMHGTDWVGRVGHLGEGFYRRIERQLHDAMQRCLVWAMGVTDAVSLSLRFFFALSDIFRAHNRTAYLQACFPHVVCTCMLPG